MNTSFWRGKKVLITGHTGFKGSWLCKWLDMLGSEVLGISLKSDGFSPYEKINFSSKYNSMYVDLGNDCSYKEDICSFNPEIVFHLASQAIVSRAFDNPLETFRSNLMGTVNVMDSLCYCPNLKVLVSITSDKVYLNRENGNLFNENDELGGVEPYSASKACQEWIVESYKNIRFSQKSVGVSTARASNVYGGGDYHYNRLIPTIIKSVLDNEILQLRNPNAVRPWQYILCLLEGYISLAENLYINPEVYSGAWNFGPNKDEQVTVGEVANILTGKSFHIQKEEYNEANTLFLNSNKSLKYLNWKVNMNLEQGLLRTFEFYKREKNGDSTNELMQEEIEYYERNFL